MDTAVIDTCTLINFKNIGRADLFEYLQYYLITTIHVVIEIKKGREDTKRFFKYLEDKSRIRHVKLSIDDLVEMASVPKHKKKLSDAELSCFIKAKSIGCKTLTDDKRAVNYAKRYINLGEVFGVADIIKEAYLKDFIGDEDVINFTKILKDNKFALPENYHSILASEKLKKHIATNQGSF